MGHSYHCEIHHLVMIQVTNAINISSCIHEAQLLGEVDLSKRVKGIILKPGSKINGTRFCRADNLVHFGHEHLSAIVDMEFEIRY